MQNLRSINRQETLWDIALLAPQYILFLALTILPFIISFHLCMADLK